VFWNAAAAAATRRKRFDSIAVAAERLDGKVLAEEGKARRGESSPWSEEGARKREKV